MQSTEIDWVKVRITNCLRGIDFVSQNKKHFYGKDADATMGITLLFEVSTSYIHDVEYDQGYQNKKDQ